MTDKFFSVVAELEDGTSKVLPVRAGAPGEAFRHARELPGVRRVGRVAEISEIAFNDLGQGRAVSSQTPVIQHKPEKTDPDAAAARPFVPHVISGPRTVVYAPPTGGEQPFKNFTVPPERLSVDVPKPQPAKPAVVVVAKPKPAEVPALVAAAPVQPVESDDSMRISQPPSPTEYRIVKSRRRDGLPYFVQRGQWQQANGRRTFDVQWEKGFADRDAAEKHLGWIEHNEREMSALQSA